MIKINDTKYDNYDIKITWESFEFGIFDKKIKGIAPYIMFNIKNNIIIGIETRLSKETLKNTNPNMMIN